MEWADSILRLHPLPTVPHVPIPQGLWPGQACILVTLGINSPAGVLGFFLSCCWASYSFFAFKDFQKGLGSPVVQGEHRMTACCSWVNAFMGWPENSPPKLQDHSGAGCPSPPSLPPSATCPPSSGTLPWFLFFLPFSCPNLLFCCLHKFWCLRIFWWPKTALHHHCPGLPLKLLQSSRLPTIRDCS